ncbi:hypothetical protein E1B28_006883 [Marasmius oreades]|uniref:Uncharacterized protein n=1 Tax=Marasmius oreades TaxID=181124 RepID=A0A9P7S0L3_9AGAR|nr:uncharacterized protein E1B28_006883 [Marasmius oreades]KAG7093194.1 hypothetical protein E1B28_006883 [Marasmius oreades]
MSSLNSPNSPQPPNHYQMPGSSTSHSVVAEDRPPTKTRPSRTPLQNLVKLVKLLWMTLFLPMVAFGYLGFCYAAASRVIPVRVHKVDNPADHLIVIKAGVTTINILIIAIALLPLQSLLGDLKSEEFFRVVKNSNLKGAPLKSVNDVSTPSYGLFQGLSSVVRKNSSGYYSTAILAGLLATVISSFAPAALSVEQTFVEESSVVAIQVGALPLGSVYNSNVISFTTDLNDKFSSRLMEGSSMAWVQTIVGKNTPFLPTSPQYAVPVPIGFSPGVRTRYLTDVIVMDPICSWETPDPPASPFLDDGIQKINITLPSQSIFNSYLLPLGRTYSKDIEVIGGGLILDLSTWINTTTQDPITDGTMGWLISQVTPTSETKVLPGPDTSIINFTGIPTQELTFDLNGGLNAIKDSNFTEPQNLTTIQFTLLVCKPRASVVTQEVRLDEMGKPDVYERTGLRRQGNINQLQAQLMLEMSIIEYTAGSGPDTGFKGIGNAGQVKLFFGPSVWNSTSLPITPRKSLADAQVLKPLPLSNITLAYQQAVQASTLSYLSGQIASTYVPGRIQTMQLIFTCSIPHVILSTVLFGIIVIWIIYCYFRPHAAPFTLISLGIAMEGSNIPEVCEDMGTRVGGDFDNEVGLEKLKNRAVLMVDSNGPGSRTKLHIL